jgi:hypothetical protein
MKSHDLKDEATVLVRTLPLIEELHANKAFLVTLALG